MKEEDTLLLNEEDGDILGLAGGIMKAIAGGFKRSRHLPSLHDEMLGEKWVLEGIMLENCDGSGNHYFSKTGSTGNAYPPQRFLVRLQLLAAL